MREETARHQTASSRQTRSSSAGGHATVRLGGTSVRRSGFPRGTRKSPCSRR
ncbi:hypothetical protein [Lysobacter gummosus]|uniref:hypothetical protein n=1 Tax=Lysobacter gummosus TaxID=262324 RepID=UPI00362FD639